MHTSGYEYAVKNGYKKSEHEWMEEQYAGYKSICARCGITPAEYDNWVQFAFPVSKVCGGAS